jgi:uncharacterized integral membrane protein
MIRIIIAIPLLLIAVLFALSNRTDTTFLLWPTDYAVVLPLSVAVFIAMAVAFVVGALFTWVSAVGARLRARRAEHKVRLLEARVAELQAKLAATKTPTAPLGTAGYLVPAGR